MVIILMGSEETNSGLFESLRNKMNAGVGVWFAKHKLEDTEYSQVAGVKTEDMFLELAWWINITL